MPNGGRITVETRNVTVAPGPDLEPGDYVVVSVSDTGTGIPPEIRDRVFEPFFTTKPKGRGTGLGLAMSHGFVKQSGGHVTLNSEVGRGTVVTLHLPRGTTPAKATAEADASAGAQGGAGGLVLLVEDDEAVHEPNVERLKQLGHEVVEAASGARAIELIEGGLRPDLVFTDRLRWLAGAPSRRRAIDDRS